MTKMVGGTASPGGPAPGAVVATASEPLELPLAGPEPCDGTPSTSPDDATSS